MADYVRNWEYFRDWRGLEHYPTIDAQVPVSGRMEECMDLRSLFKTTDDVRQFQSGTTIFAEGAPADAMYVVLDGEVEVRVGSEAFEVIGPGDIVGEMALIDGKARSATAVAKSDCRLAPVDEKRFQFMVQQTPSFSLHVMRVLVDRLRRMNARWDE